MLYHSMSPGDKMARYSKHFLLRLAMISMLICLSAMAGESKKRAEPRMSFIENGTIKLGVDLNAGGAITYLSPANNEANLINSYDWGRQVQMSYYSGPVPFVAGDNSPKDHWKHLGWNPIQAGDDFGHGSKVLEHRNDGKSMYVKCIPMQWPLDNEPGECTFESWLELDGNTVRARCRLLNQRSDKTHYSARNQELPAVYTNGPYYRLMTYCGAKPFTDGELTRIQKDPKKTFPWTSFSATEHWAALVDDNDWGLGVWQPACLRFLGGTAGKMGSGGMHDSPTGYIAPVENHIIDHNIQHEYTYTLIVGDLKTIRDYVKEHSRREKLPRFDFKTDRQGWYYANASDKGWPIDGELNIVLDKNDPQLLSPDVFWIAEDAPKLMIEAAFKTSEPQAQIFCRPFAEGAGDTQPITFEIKPDGEFRTYEVNLSRARDYRGAMMRLRIDPVSKGGEGQFVRVRKIYFAAADAEKK
jgi:hypothetical protein